LVGVTGPAVSPGRASAPRSTRLADTVFYVCAIVFLVVGIGRAALALSVVPVAAARWQISRAGGGSVPTLESKIALAVNQPLFLSWWSGRRAPWLTGDSYLQALGRRPLTQTLGSVIGAVVVKQRADGVLFNRMVMPPDKPAITAELVGTGYSAVFEGAAGNTNSIPVSHPRRYVERLTGMRVDLRPYNPLLTDEALYRLIRDAKQVPGVKHFFVVRPPANASGTWVLYSHSALTGKAPRDFFLVPIELAPVPIPGEAK
jgi:hypothetical protein